MSHLTIAERFWTKVKFTDTCWLWTAATIRGYGLFWHSNNRPNARAHRWSYEFCVGPIPDDLEIDHLCRVRHCVNPDHLEIVTHQVNVLRGQGVAAIQARKKLCKNGHPFSKENTIHDYKNKKHRRCKICRKDASRRNMTAFRTRQKSLELLS